MSFLSPVNDELGRAVDELQKEVERLEAKFRARRAKFEECKSLLSGLEDAKKSAQELHMSLGMHADCPSSLPSSDQPATSSTELGTSGGEVTYPPTSLPLHSAMASLQYKPTPFHFKLPTGIVTVARFCEENKNCHVISAFRAHAKVHARNFKSRKKKKLEAGAIRVHTASPARNFKTRKKLQNIPSACNNRHRTDKAPDLYRAEEDVRKDLYPP